MEIGLVKIEVFLRASAMVVLVLTACLVALDSQTNYFFSLPRKASSKDLDALQVLVYVDSVLAAYNLLQISRYFVSARLNGKPKWSTFKILAWVSFLLDQTAAYAAFGTSSAGLEAALLAVTGVHSFEWMKVCNIYTRFCIQIGGALLCCYVAALLMVATSIISAFNLFRLYSPTHFLVFKPN